MAIAGGQAAAADLAAAPAAEPKPAEHKPVEQPRPSAGLPYADLAPNRWVSMSFRCVGGKPDYAKGCPSSRGWVQLAYDSKRGQVVLFGGSGEWYFNDLWGFDWRERVWTLIEPDTRLEGKEQDKERAADRYPRGRDNYQWAYDAKKDKFWLYGGTAGAGFWEWQREPRQWRLAQSQHDGKSLPHATLDPAFALAEELRGILFFGGERHAFEDHTWWFDLDKEHWERLEPKVSPPPRAQTENAMVYDPARRQFILFGGRSPNGKPTNDTWIFSAEKRTWRPVKSDTAPPARDSHILVFDRKNQVAILLGGQNLQTADTWIFDPRTEKWHELESARGSYVAGDSRVVSAVYVPEADLTIYRDLKGRMYFLRLALPAGPLTP
jgi:hypothetical protein